MPLTPFHLGPALLLGLVFFGWLDFPTFLVANVIVDIEPILVILLSLDYPLHGFLHSFLGGTGVAVLLAWAMMGVRGRFSPLLRFFRLEQESSLKGIPLAALSGVYIHILLDSRMYGDIRPFYPLDVNPFLSLGSGWEIYSLCFWCFIGGMALYAARLAVGFWGRRLNRRRLIALSVFLVCLFSVIGALSFWEPERRAEADLQEYLERLEVAGCAIEEGALADVRVDGLIRIHFFGDFLSFSRQGGMYNVYLDRGIHALYFLRPYGEGRIEAYVFYYK